MGECFKREFYEHEICVRLHTGWSFFSTGESVCTRVVWSGTRSGIGNEHLMGVIIRVW